MRYTRFREYLNRMNRDERSGRDSRNPYGSRGGYVVSGRDRAHEEDMARGRDRARRMGYFDYNTEDYARGRDRAGDMARGGRGRDNADYGDYNMDYAGRGRDRARGGDRGYDGNDYADYGDYDYARGDRGYDYGYDMARRRDYAEENYKLTPSEIRKWEKELKKENGTAFTSDQVRQIAQQQGIRFEEFTPELLTVIANVMYSDYGESVKGDITTFVKMAKDFLCDDDFDGTPEEKAYLYYNAIVNKEDD